MNAPIRFSETVALGGIEEFRECCDVHAWFFSESWISLQTAVDNLQYLAERWVLLGEVGQDIIQQTIAAPFARLRAEPRQAAQHDAGFIARSTTVEDTGREPPPVPKREYRTPRATIDAFLHVARNENTEYLARWLKDHPSDAPQLLIIWKAKCAAT